LRNQRLLQRAEALLSQRRRIGDCAAELGFHDANYFTRWFRKQTGQSPSAWRKGGS
jgi:AraC-like DNA-binding protein